MLHPAIVLVLLLVLIGCAWQAGWHGWCLLRRWRVRRAARQPAILPVDVRQRNHGFIYDRLRPDRLIGLPLTLLLTAGLCMLILGSLAALMTVSDTITALDRRVSSLLEPWRTPVMIELFRWITGLGDAGALIAVVLVASGFLWTSGRHNRLAGLWVAMLGSQLTTYAGKFGFARERPEFATDITVYTAAFPSAHASASLAVFGFIAYAIARDLPGARLRYEVTFWSLMLAGLIGFSRIFLNVHHASDVAAGYLIGGLWLLVGILIAERLQSPPSGAPATGFGRR